MITTVELPTIIQPRPGVAIVDEFLGAWQWNSLQEYTRTESLRAVGGADWIRVWRIGDGVPLRGITWEHYKGQTYALDREGQTAPVVISEIFENVISIFCNDVVRKAGICTDGWTKLCAALYAYPPRTSLAWHRDDDYMGSFVLYCHNYWGARWGGELLLRGEGKGAFTWDSFDSSSLDSELLQIPFGYFVPPRSNRLVLMAANVPHMIAPVRELAGERVRLSLAGFFYRDKE